MNFVGMVAQTKKPAPTICLTCCFSNIFISKMKQFQRGGAQHENVKIALSVREQKESEAVTLTFIHTHIHMVTLELQE